MSPIAPHIELEVYLGKLRSSQELAEQMGVSRNYILAMKRRGFSLPGGKASLHMAKHFLTTCGDFKVNAERRPAPPQTPASSSGTAHAPNGRNARRKPSSGSLKTQPRKA
jgi:hypothetical protein